MNTTQIGRAAEQAVADDLQARGCKIISRNERSRYYEIDIIAADKHVVRFIEVKFRRDDWAGGGIESITATKKLRLVRAAEAWLGEHQKYCEFEKRIDLCCTSRVEDSFELEYIENITG